MSENGIMLVITNIKGGRYMNINAYQSANIYSIKQALNIAVLRKSMNQDGSSVDMLVNDMLAANTKIMEQSITPYKGGNIDIRV